MRSPWPLAYVPYEELDGRPSVVVDGAAAPGTVLVLSHWPKAPAPPGLARDLSAEMAFAYLDRRGLHGGAAFVSNNHFDQDGLVSVFALVDPDAALARRDLLVDLAGAGDFATYADRRAARASMAVAAYADPSRSPLGSAGADADADDDGRWSAALYAELLGRLPELVCHPERYRELWAEEDACLSASEALVASGAVMIDEVPELDLAVVRVPEDAPRSGGHRFGGDWVSGLHPMAVANATGRTAVLTMTGGRAELTYRYESWVQFRSRPVRARRDLVALAGALDAAEGVDDRWRADKVSALVPALRLAEGAETAIGPDELVALVTDHLRTAPPAWDPYLDSTGNASNADP